MWLWNTSSHKTQQPLILILQEIGVFPSELKAAYYGRLWPCASTQFKPGFFIPIMQAAQCLCCSFLGIRHVSLTCLSLWSSTREGIKRVQSTPQPLQFPPTTIPRKIRSLQVPDKCAVSPCCLFKPHCRAELQIESGQLDGWRDDLWPAVLLSGLNSLLKATSSLTCHSTQNLVSACHLLERQQASGWLERPCEDTRNWGGMMAVIGFLIWLLWKSHSFRSILWASPDSKNHFSHPESFLADIFTLIDFCL